MITTIPPDKSPELLPLGDGLNFSAPLDRVEGTVVATPLFFVRSNYPPPDLSATTWSLRVDGLVRRPLSLGLADLQALPRQQQEMWLECAGNSREHFDPPAEGNQWNDWAVSNAVFNGAPLRAVLEQAGLLENALEVLASGGDSPQFQRSLPVEIAMRANVLLAWQINGGDIPLANGGPVRLIVPGWPGIASVKWPARFEVIDRPFEGYYHKERYVILDADGKLVGPIRQMPVKSIVASHRAGARVAPGSTRLSGFAWSGAAPIQRVEVSVDGGRGWTEAQLRRGEGPLAWVRWDLDWTSSTMGMVQVMSRASDATGGTQPETTPWNRFGYLMNGYKSLAVELEVSSQVSSNSG